MGLEPATFGATIRRKTLQRVASRAISAYTSQIARVATTCNDGLNVLGGVQVVYTRSMDAPGTLAPPVPLRALLEYLAPHIRGCLFSATRKRAPYATSSRAGLARAY